MFSQRSTPAKMTAEAARKLPRYALLALLTVFIVCGLAAQDLWTVRDAENFGVAMTMVSGGLTDALLPNVTGEAIAGHGPLTAWTAALFVKLFSGVAGEVGAYRLTALLWFALTTAALWYGTWQLARRPEAQPIAFAFGGEAKPRDYGRVVADSAVLLFVATFGIVTRQHEVIPDTALLTFAALHFYGLARSLTSPYRGAFLAGLASGFAVLSATLFAGVWLLAATVLVQALFRSLPGNRDLRLLIAGAGAALPTLLWMAAAFATCPEEALSWFTVWASEQAAHFGLVSASTLLWFVKNFAWYLCPLWPLVLWGLYSWRRQLEATHLALPLVLIGTGFFAAFLSSSQAADQVFLTFIPAAAVFAAFGLITVKRSKENVLDWFSISVFGLAVLAAWAYWAAWALGFPPKMAHSVEMLAPGVRPTLDAATLFAAAVTVIWTAFIVWRLTHRPKVAWRGPWLAALGMTACAASAMGLFHSAVDRNRSYEPVALEAARQLARFGMTDADCVEAPRLVPGIRALFAHYGGFTLAATPETRCRFEIVRITRGGAPERALGTAMERPRTDEQFYLLPGRLEAADSLRNQP